MFKDSQFQGALQFLMVLGIILALILLFLWGLLGIIGQSPSVCADPSSMDCRIHEMKVCATAAVYSHDECVQIIETRVANPAK